MYGHMFVLFSIMYAPRFWWESIDCNWDSYKLMKRVFSALLLLVFPHIMISVLSSFCFFFLFVIQICMSNVSDSFFLFITETFVIIINLSVINIEVISDYVHEAKKINCCYKLQAVSISILIPEGHQIARLLEMRQPDSPLHTEIYRTSGLGPPDWQNLSAPPLPP